MKAIIPVIFLSFLIVACAQQPVACTMEAKVCPDGSAIGRSGPNCEFAACPGDSYRDCAAAENPIMESYPEQCRWPNGTTVMNVVIEKNALEVLQTEEPYRCETDADCEVKNIGNCCGYFPACVSKLFKPDPTGVSSACEREGLAGICGFREPTGCACVNGLCKDADS